MDPLHTHSSSRRDRPSVASTYPWEAGDGQKARQAGGAAHPKREHWPSPAGKDRGVGRELGSTGHPGWAPNSLPGTGGTRPALTSAAARTFWFKLLPWRGSGGPENTARHEIRRVGGHSAPRHEAGWGRTLAPDNARPLEQPPQPGRVLQHHAGLLPALLPQLPHSSPRYLLPPV